MQCLGLMEQSVRVASTLKERLLTLRQGSTEQDMPKLQLVHELPPSFPRCHAHLGELSFRKETVTGEDGGFPFSHAARGRPRADHPC